MSQYQTDPLDEPIDVGDRFRWADEEGGLVEVLGMSITEDGVVQVRVADGDERHTVTADDLVGVVSDGRLARDD